MPITQFILGLVLAVISLCLVVAVLMQPGKDKRLSGAIAGGADTFFSKGKAGRWDKTLGKLTVAMCVILFVLIVVMYCVIIAA
ncbi:MAG: preprotein translocase subunit SecG [Clostridia bacterium]|nr:preprotein translocase subunit SecG [Clostridia bacterium]